MGREGSGHLGVCLRSVGDGLNNRGQVGPPLGREARADGQDDALLQTLSLRADALLRPRALALQFAIAGLVFRFVNSKEPEIVVKIWERENQQKKIMGDVLCVALRILC